MNTPEAGHSTTATLEQLRVRYPHGAPVRRGTCYGVVDDVTIMQGHPAIYVTWMHADGGKTSELVAASQIILARTTR